MAITFAAAALGARKAAGLAKKVPWQVWAGLGLVLVLWLGVRWHDRRIERLKAETRTEVVRQLQAQAKRIEAKAVQLRVAAEKLQDTINEEARITHVQGQSAIRDRYAAQRLRDAKASNQRPAISRGTVPAVPGSAGGNAQDARGDGLSRALALDILEQCELNTATLVSWQGWYRQQALAHQAWLETQRRSASDGSVPRRGEGLAE